MSKYAIGDIQGHFKPLMGLLDKIHFDPKQDELILLGDVVNRGPQSLEVLRFILAHQDAVKMVLGNHDLYLMHLFYGQGTGVNHTLNEVLAAAEIEEIMNYLRKQPFLIHDESLNLVMTHAGIAPTWTLEMAKAYAQEHHYFDKHPSFLEPRLTGLARYQVIADYFTRMRFVDIHGHMVFNTNGYPWFACPKRVNWPATIVFGHWASLKGKTGFRRIQALDTGCHWGGALTALNLETMERIGKSC